MKFAVLATGPSLSSADVELIRGKLAVVAVSDAYRLAPWADALVSADAAWWKAHPNARDFAGLKFGAIHDFNNVPYVEPLHGAFGLNSGLLGLIAAVRLGAKEVYMLGFDMHSPTQHFFGEHPKPLRSTTPDRMERFKRQFAAYKPKGVKIINCTKGSALECYEMGVIQHYVGVDTRRPLV